MSEIILFLPNTDCLQQIKYYARGCSTAAKYWQSSTNIDRLQQVEDYVRGTCSRNPRPWGGLHDTALCDKVCP